MQFKNDLNTYYNISGRKEKLIAIDKDLFYKCGDTENYLYQFLIISSCNRNLHILDFLFD